MARAFYAPAESRAGSPVPRGFRFPESTAPMFLSLFMWLTIGAIAGALTRLVAPQNSYGWRGEIAIGIAGAIAGGFAWPMLDVFLGVGVFNAAIGGFIGASLALPAMRMARPELMLFLYPAPSDGL
jgi:uncharacterized membrane protein YeaQ/YmgE (transglycosylase-associated protein family)